MEKGSFDFKRRLTGLIGGPLLAVLIYLRPLADLNYTAHTLLAIMVLVAVWWVTEPVPIPVTSMIGPMLAVIFGITSVKDAFAAFANPMIFLFLGGFVLAKAMMVHGLDKRFVYWMLSHKWVGSDPKRFFLMVGVAAALCSGWISNTATAAMMFPICLGLLGFMKEIFEAKGQKLDLKQSKYATGLMLMTAYSCSIGGVLTPIGTPPNLLMLGFLDTMEGIRISFLEWMLWGSLVMVLYFVIAYIVLTYCFPCECKKIDGADVFINKKLEEMGAWTRAQKNTLLAFVVTVVLWVMPGILSLSFGNASPILKTYTQHFPEAVAALVGASLLFLLPVNVKKCLPTLKWSEASEGIEWGTLILFGGGLAMGGMMYATGLSEWIGQKVVGAMGGTLSEITMVAVFSVVALFLSELTSNTAATNMVGPLAITMAVSMGISPIPVSISIALSTSLGFMLPVSTPPNAIVYASGYVPITKMIKTGFIIDLIGILCVTIPVCIFVVKWILGI